MSSIARFAIGAMIVSAYGSTSLGSGGLKLKGTEDATASIYYEGDAFLYDNSRLAVAVGGSFHELRAFGTSETEIAGGETRGVADSYGYSTVWMKTGRVGATLTA